MKNKAKVSISIFAMVIGSIVISEYSSPANGNTSGSPAGRTGSPGDGANCNSCHLGTAATQAGLITSNIPTAGYTPGQTYTITGSINTPAKTKFGFQISPQDVAGALKGSLIITNATTTKLVSSGKYVTHQSTGTSFPSGTATWSFDWTAPVSGSGALTFYGAFNSSNNNSSSTGDVITLSSVTVAENLISGIADISNNSDQISIYPNPVADKLYLNNSCAVAQDQKMKVSIIDMHGRVVRKADYVNNNQFIDVEGFANGYYTVRIETPAGVVIKKMVKK